MSRQNGYLTAGLILAGLTAALILLGFFWTPYDPNAMSMDRAGPSLAHLMGTDNFGRDILSRVMKGAGATASIALATVAIGAVCGTAIGALTGYVILALGLVFIPSYARITRTAFAALRDVNYVKSARLMGAGSGRILLVHILPNAAHVLLPALTIGFNNAVLAEASMSYLGIGVTPPDASLGYMLSEAQGMFGIAPWYAVGCSAGAGRDRNAGDSGFTREISQPGPGGRGWGVPHHP